MALYIDDPPDSILSLRRERLDVRPSGDTDAVHVAVLNLMPDKRAAERQVARLLAGTRHDVRLSLFVVPGHRPRNESPDYLARHYVAWRDLVREPVDALIVTGTPLERQPFEDVRYWTALRLVLDWSRTEVTSSWFSCWGAMAALYYDHGIPKRTLRSKCFGLYAQEVEGESALTEGIGERYLVPVSRHATVPRRWIDCDPGLSVLAASGVTGPGLIAERGLRRVYMLDHPEYESGTLLAEYRRDRAAGLDPRPPRGYDVSEDATLPSARWQRTGITLLGNWLGWVLATQRAPARRRLAARAA